MVSLTKHLVRGGLFIDDHLPSNHFDHLEESYSLHPTNSVAALTLTLTRSRLVGRVTALIAAACSCQMLLLLSTLLPPSARQYKLPHGASG